MNRKFKRTAFIYMQTFCYYCHLINYSILAEIRFWFLWKKN